MHNVDIHDVEWRLNCAFIPMKYPVLFIKHLKDLPEHDLYEFLMWKCDFHNHHYYDRNFNATIDRRVSCSHHLFVSFFSHIWLIAAALNSE